MSEFNFDNMKNVDIPESWVDGALSVPKDLKTPFPFLKYSKIIAFAASIVLVCCLSVALFFITNSEQAVPPVKNDETIFNSQIQISSEKDENTENMTENESQSDSTASTQAETQSQKENETAQPTDKDDELTDSSESKPVEKPEKPEKPKPTANAEKPTKPTKPTKPIPTEKPTEDYSEVEPPESETLSYIEKYTNGKITANIHHSEYSGYVYCRMYDSNGALVGDSDLFSSNREAIQIDSIMTEDSEHSVYEYNTENLRKWLQNGYYRVVFYDENGTDICMGYINIS